MASPRSTIASSRSCHSGRLSFFLAVVILSINLHVRRLLDHGIELSQFRRPEGFIADSQLPTPLAYPCRQSGGSPAGMDGALSHLVLFDIDLTLLRLNAVGRTAMTAALLEMTKIEDGLAGIEFAGRTDRWILRQALAAAAHSPDDFEVFLTDFDGRYLPHLKAQLPLLGGELLPGVVELLDRLAAMPDVRLGLATGNLRNAAWFKLKAFGLDRYFLDGGFADDAEERHDLVAAAIGRLGGAVEGYRVIVIGDSPHDISAAKSNGAVAVGVATGRSSMDGLREAGADLVLPDLATPDPLLALLADGESGRGLAHHLDGYAAEQL